MRVGVFQFFPEFGNVKANLQRVENALAKAEMDLLVLPELFNSGYLFESPAEVKELSEEIPGGFTTERLLRLAKERQTAIVAGMPEYDPVQDKYYNSAVVLTPEGYAGKYRKTHLYYKENKWFSLGDLGFQVFELPSGVRIGVMVCFDWFFPEAARSLAIQGAQIICQPSNLVLPYCQQAMLTRSLENSIFSITANRVGSEQRDEENLTFTGQSQVVDPKGQVVLRMGETEERLAVAEIDPQLAHNKQLNMYNDLFDNRRPAFYGELTCDTKTGNK